MNEEGKELTVDFVLQQLEIEDCNAHHKSLSQLDSSTSINFAAYDHRQNRGKNSKKNRSNGKNQGQNKPGAQGSSNSSHQSRKPPGIEDKCMRCGNQEHQLGQRCQPRMLSVRLAIKLDISTKCARARKEPPSKPYLFRAPKMMMTPTLMKMESDNQMHLQG